MRLLLSINAFLLLTIIFVHASPYSSHRRLDENNSNLGQERIDGGDEGDDGHGNDDDSSAGDGPNSEESKKLRDKWDSEHCQIKGCKKATDSLLALIRVNPEAKARLLSRNQISDPLFNLPPDMKPIKSLDRDVQYLGVLLDGGRHYYPIDWIHNVLQVMHAMGYNLLHFRLTDDQAFNMKLDSMPELANPAMDSPDGSVYTSSELKDLVAYAKSLDIVIMPEVNLPGHAGGWAGNHTPNLIVPCAQEICSRGYGLPLNLKHPKLLSIVTTVLKEVLSIFSTAPFLHLGGDEVHMAKNCLQEARYAEYDTDIDLFERELKKILENELSFSSSKVVRWETTNNAGTEVGMLVKTKSKPRAGEIVHYWSTRDYQVARDAPPVFCSEGLYFDTNGQEGAWNIFGTTRRMLVEPKPIAIIAGTFELRSQQWMDRNVVGRMLAVAMGASKHLWDMESFKERYASMCRDDLNFDERLCDLNGAPALTEFLFRVEMSDMHSSFQEMLCQNLTQRETSRDLAHRSWAKHNVYRDAMANFWDHFGDDIPQFASSVMELRPLSNVSHSLNFLRDHQPGLQYRGIILDLVQIDFEEESMSRIFSILNLMNLLGLNMLQLRIMGDLGFAVSLSKHRELTWADDAPFTIDAIENIVTRAEFLGIHVIPEITTATRAGGWFGAGILANCPETMCKKGTIGVNATDPTILGATISMMHELMQLFHNPAYIHLGYDERTEVQACYDEAELRVDLDHFEYKLIEALKFQDFDISKLIRWENIEGIVYPHRAGEVTHYRMKMPTNKSSNSGPFFLSSGLNFTDHSLNAWDLFQKTRELSSYRPTGILAVVDIVHEAFLKDFAVIQRLVAVSMGASSSEWTRPEFQKALKEILTSMKVEENFEGELPDANLAREHLESHTNLRKRNACIARTTHLSKEVPKEGVFSRREK